MFDIDSRCLMTRVKKHSWNNVEQKSHENLTDVRWVGVRPHDEIFMRFCSTLFHNVSWMFGILLHAPSLWNIVEQNLTNVWRHTMRFSWDFVWRCSQMFHVVSLIFDVVSQKSHGQNLTKISSCGRAFTYRAGHANLHSISSAGRRTSNSNCPAFSYAARGKRPWSQSLCSGLPDTLCDIGHWLLVVIYCVIW
jgi:hypothetical protein